MSITYPLSLPTTKSPARITIQQNCIVGISASIFTGQQQVQDWQGGGWSASVTLPRMERSDAAVWQGFLLSLCGQWGTFLLGDPSATSPRGIATGTPLVKGGSQTGRSLDTDGWTVSQTGILKAGDYIQIGYRLYMVMKDANSDGSGNATFDIWPALRESPADNTALDLTSPVGTFRLAKSSIAIATTDITQLKSLSFAAVEAI